MSEIGTVAALWRYPVKSMLGEELATAEVNQRGLACDRAYAVVDPVENRVGSAKIPHKWARLYEFRAAYPDSTAGAAQVTFPDRTVMMSDDPGLDAALSRALGREVKFVSQPPAGLRLEVAKPGTDPLTLERTVDFPLVNPFFDFGPVHLLTTATLDGLRSLYPEGDFDPRRFRPNVIIDTRSQAGFVENGWVGRTLALGEEVRLRVIMPTGRCAATTLAHSGLPNDPEILRTAKRHNSGNVGVYATVVQGGVVRCGDGVRLIDNG